jgi:type VI secretion system protein ImpB
MRVGTSIADTADVKEARPNMVTGSGRQQGGRMRIVCKPSDDEQEVELPLRMLFVGNFVGEDRRAIEERVPVRVDPSTVSKVMVAHGPCLDLTVAGVRAQLVFRSMADFGPDAIAGQIPDLERKLNLRDALTRLKTTGDVEAFVGSLPELVADPVARERLLSDLQLPLP